MSFELAIAVREVDHSLGPRDARVTVVEYGDFQCPDCRRAVPAVKLLPKHFPDPLRIVFRHFPLERVHPQAVDAALAAECAGAQSRFWPMHDLLFEDQPRLALAQFGRYARQLDLDMARFDIEMEERRYIQRVRDDIDGGKRSGVRGTPTFFVNGTIVDVSFSLQRLFDAVEQAFREASPIFATRGEGNE